MYLFKDFKKNKNILYLIILSVFSISINQFYGYIGILPIDSFLVFNSGYDFLNGHYPFKDYWTIKEPFIDFLQAIFFKLFGVSWFVYVLHASIFNFLITISTFFILRYFNLNSKLSFFYSFCVAILTYPTAGTPFSDHHTLILCILSLYIFFIALKKNNNYLWFILPFFLGFSFLSKQAPTAYLILVITIISLLYFINKKRFNGLIFAFLGTLFFLISFFLLLFFAEISLKDFFIQYILFPKSLGASRLDWVFPLEFKRVVLRFKIHYLSISLLIYILIRTFILKKEKIKLEDLLVITSLILVCLLFIFHHLMTINAIFIYCLIPIFCGFSHSYFNFFLKKKYLSNFLIALTFFSTIYYFVNYVHNRTFMDLNKTNLNKAVNAELIDKRFKGIKWLTMFYPDNPREEIKNIKFAMQELSKDKTNKMIITDYQFISVFLNKYDYSVTRFWYDYHGYPSRDNKYFDYWKEFVSTRLKKNNIKTIYIFHPLHGEPKPVENIFGNCLVREKLSKTFYKLDISNCLKFL